MLGWSEHNGRTIGLYLMAFSFKMLNEEGQGDFVLLFAIDWPLVDISEFMYSTGTKKSVWTQPCHVSQFPPIFTLLKYILYAGDDDGTIPIPWLNLNDQLGDIVDRADGSDVPFSVGGETFHAHHAVLAARSPVFKTELLGSMAESAMPCVTLHNIDPATFKALLHFVYMDALLSPTGGGASSTSTTTGFFESLLVAVDMYALKRLKLMCAQKLGESVSVETVATTLGYAETYHCPELKSKCLSFLMAESSFKKVAFTDGYFHLRRDFPLIIEEIKKQIES
uniref:BTB domain-containing protein n=1 Tax=Oryza glumipatula TaxID=40148 RepID=A0A0E0AZZ7_9ORYZ